LGTVARALNGKAALAAADADNVKNVRRCILLALGWIDSAGRCGDAANILPEIPIPEKHFNEG
jgi:hypothetical protein